MGLANYRQSAWHYRKQYRWSKFFDNVLFHVFPPALLNIVNGGEHFTVTEGENIKLRCLASSLVTPTVTWKRGDDDLVPTETKVSEDGNVVSGYLSIEDVKPKDAGKYVCEARNGPKSVEAEIELVVSGT